MNNSIELIQKLRVNSEAWLDKTSQLQQAIAQLEATLSRMENQKGTEKSRKE